MRRIDKEGFFEEVKALALCCGSRYKGNTTGHEKLLRMAWANGWFLEDGTVRLDDEDDYRFKMGIWLESYGLSRKEKMDLLCRAMLERFPGTYAGYKEFFEDEREWRLYDRLVMTDFLLSAIRKELGSYTEEELQPVIASSGEYLTTAQTDLLLRFLASMERHGLKLDYRYEPGQRQLVSPRNDAYTLHEYARMAYWVFNEEAWEGNGTMKAAMEKKKYADIWLFIALHFVCAIRAKDMGRLPAPDLPCTEDELRKSLLEGSFRGKEAAGLCSTWLYKIEILEHRPGKTAVSDVPAIKVMVPASLREPFGIILAAAATWHKKGETFIVCRAGVQDIGKVFGKGFRETAGRTRFSSRRANKAFLQGLESVSDEGIQGYMLAALARSHKGGIGSLPETTVAYLRDQNFTGHTPEFIAREMFERGVFGFVPVLLLESYRKERYRALGVRGQTELISLIGLSPGQIERVTCSVTCSLEKAQAALNKIFLSGESDLLKKAIQKVAVGRAPAKQEELLCVRNAAGYGCDRPERRSCLGCGCEIYTQGMLHLLLCEYRDLVRKKEGACPAERGRIEALLLEGLLPAVSQIILTAGELCPDGDSSVLLDGIERELKDAGLSGKEGTE